MRHLWAGLIVVFTATAALADSAPRDLSTGDDLAPFRAVGRLDLGGRGFCTATLIGVRLVLTAAHCVLDADGRPVPPETLAFSAGLSDGLAVAERRGRQVAVAEGYDPARSDLANLAADVALVALDRPVDPALVMPIPVGRPGGRRVGVVSYAHDRTERPSIEGACAVLERREEALILSCLADFGVSGAPVLRRRPGGLEVVSVVSAMAETEDGTRVSIGADLSVLHRLGTRIEGIPARLAQGVRRAPVLSREEARRAGPGKFLRP